LAMVEGYQPPKPAAYQLPGPTGKAAMAMAVDGFHRQGKATDYDRVVLDALADTLAGGDADIIDTLDEDRILELELQNFMKIARNRGTLARIEHMLETGKPLRN
ncbi:MAG: 3-hydroxyacyl-CoA dehydrogenase, partial [Hyphomicrobiaceae bacterium]|nr:3-hydroxyacyl-CoA dehydrogenase [Hyphomicrobiaceae bacterium]